MSSHTLALTALLAPTLFLAGPASGQTAALADTVRRELTRYAASGAVVALVVGDSTILLEGFGTTRHDEGAAAVTPDLLFGTVRLRDVLTAVLAVRLEELGRLDLDAPIGAYAGDLPPRIGAVTLRQLLSHTAGLDDAENVPSRRRAVSTTWPGATDAALFTEPGVIHSTSRHSYPLARAILEARTGSAESALLSELVLVPAGLRDATLDPAAAERRGTVPGHVVSTSSAQPLVALTPTANPMPQLYASARDLAALMRSWMRPAAARPPGDVPATSFRTVALPVAALPAGPADSVALGVAIANGSGRREISYAEGEAGYGILIRMFPEVRIGIAVIANATGAVLSRTADAVLAPRLSPLPARTAPSPGGIVAPAQRPGAAAAMAGTYANGDRIIILDARADSLYWRDGGVTLPVVRTGTRLEAVIGDGRTAQSFHFTRDEAGIAYLVVDGRAYRRQSARGR